MLGRLLNQKLCFDLKTGINYDFCFFLYGASINESIPKTLLAVICGIMNPVDK